MSKIYLASSWRNTYYPHTLIALREAGHEVFDFRNPTDNSHGFHWSEIDPNWKQWTPAVYRHYLRTHRLALNGYRTDKAGLEWCEVGVLLLPCGRSAHLELGECIGKGKPSFVLMLEPSEPELMYAGATDIATSIEELLEMLKYLTAT